MKVMIIGSSGQLGAEIKNLKQKLNLSNIFFYDKKKLDISKPEIIDSFFMQNSFDIVINCAAYTNVDEAETNFNHAKNINADSIGYICSSLEKYKSNTILIHLSTDYIFDGNFKAPIKEEEAPNPISKYGESKLLGEQMLQKSKIPSIIIRVSWLYSINGSNFMKTIIDLAKRKKSINVISDQIGSPTSANDLANAILDILNSDRLFFYAKKKEIFNFCNRGSCSWYQFAKEILFKISSECEVLPVTTDEYFSVAERPKYSVLNTSKIENSFGLNIRPWKAALQNTINTLNSNYNRPI
tara:strand:+ start:102276 stop:103169 length:894 start_codon:yes stop_codon:yes gene_type:complete